MAKGDTLTLKEKRFAEKYMETGNATEATVAAGYNVKSRNVAKNIGSENLSKPDIRAYIQEMASGAASRIVEMSMNAENETVRLSANKDILDRGGYKAPERLDVTSGGEPIGGFEYIIPIEHEETNDTSNT